MCRDPNPTLEFPCQGFSSTIAHTSETPKHIESKTHGMSEMQPKRSNASVLDDGVGLLELCHPRTRGSCTGMIMGLSRGNEIAKYGDHYL